MGLKALIKILARTGGGTLPWSQSREGRSGQGAGANGNMINIIPFLLKHPIWKERNKKQTTV